MIPVGKLGQIPERIMWKYKAEKHEMCVNSSIIKVCRIKTVQQYDKTVLLKDIISHIKMNYKMCMI